MYTYFGVAAKQERLVELEVVEQQPPDFAEVEGRVELLGVANHVAAASPLLSLFHIHL